MAYQIALPGMLRIHDIFHVSLLERFHGKPTFAPAVIDVDGEPEYEVERILSHRKIKNKI